MGCHVLYPNLGKNPIYFPKECFYQKTTFKNLEKLMLPSPESCDLNLTDEHQTVIRNIAI